MPPASAYRDISVILALAGILFIAWITVVPFGFVGAPVAAAITIILTLAFACLGTDHSIQYWSAAEKPAQFPRIAAVIAAALSLHLIIGGVIQTLEWAFIPEPIIALSVWGLVPLAALRFGFLQWPRRCAKPRRSEFLAVAGAAILFAVAFGALATLNGGRDLSFSTSLLARAANVASLATVEEIVFRVLLVTALLQASRSKIYALIISSFLFGLGHAPLVLSQPLIAGDWPLLLEAAKAYLPGLVWQVGVGFILGAVWLRTGSIILIAVVHTILNVNLMLG